MTYGQWNSMMSARVAELRRRRRNEETRQIELENEKLKLEIEKLKKQINPNETRNNH